jgi:hypothetical protein
MEHMDKIFMVTSDGTVWMYDFGKERWEHLIRSGECDPAEKRD